LQPVRGRVGAGDDVEERETQVNWLKWLRRKLGWGAEVRVPMCAPLMWIPEIAERLTGSQVDAITIAGTTYYWRGADDPALRAHEQKHREQQARDGFLFLPKYVAFHVRFGYDRNPYEVEAREAEKEVKS